MINRLAVVAFLALTVGTSLSYANNGWSVEFRPGVSVPVDELAGAELSVGFGFEGTVAYTFMPFTSAYAGWGWNRLSADNTFAGDDIDFEETGYVAGLRFTHPLLTGRLKYLLSAGGIYSHIETEDSDGDILDSTPHGLGWQAGAGLEVSLTDNLAVTPSLRYSSLSREIGYNNAILDANLRYLSAGVGISWSLGSR